MLPLLLILAAPQVRAALQPDDAQAILLIEAQRLPAEALGSFAASEDADTRARAALALGRLRDPSALPALTALAAAPEATVRAAAAFSLGLCPEGDGVAARLLETETDALVRSRLYAAIGLHPKPEHLGLLSEGLALSAAEASAAATSLGRYGIAKVEGVDAVELTDALAGSLTRRIDPKARQAAAFALARIGASALSPATADALIRRARIDHDVSVRAWLLRALGPALAGDPRGAELLAISVKDPDSGVRAAAARAIPKMGGDASLALLESALADPTRSVRLSAVVAAGSVEGVDHRALLGPLLEGDDPELVGLALVALSEAGEELDVRRWMKPDQPELVRASAISTLTDIDQLVRLATRSPEGSLRTAAAGTIMGLSPTPAQAIQLLAASDDKVTAVGATLLTTSPAAEAVTPLLTLAKTTGDGEVLGECLRALAATLPLLKAPPTDELSAVLREAGQHPDAPVRAAAAALAEAMGVPSPRRPHAPPPLPDLAEVERIVSVRVLTDAGELRFAMRPDLAPLTVWNFATLAEDDYFDGLAFHRVVPDFVIQDGCPRGDGWGGPGYAIPDELSWLPYDEGVLGMALSGPDTGGSQWFVTLSPQPHLDAGYTVFGELTGGKATLHRVQKGTVINDVIIERLPAEGS